MAGLLGALRGVSRGLVLLILVALLPGLAWGAAVLGEHALGTSFWSVFLGALGVLGFLAFFAVMGAADAVQAEHAAEPDADR